MAIFCVNCGVNLVGDYIIRKGEEISNPYITCPNCGEWAGIPIPKPDDKTSNKESDGFNKLIEDGKEFTIKDGSISGK